MKRREFLANAALLKIAAVWASPACAGRPLPTWREDRAAYPDGVASGDPDEHSVILWTRRPFAEGPRHRLFVEVATDHGFRDVVATASCPVLALSDWTGRVLIGGLMPSTTYWYRFSDASGAGSRIGRTITAPRVTDERPVRFAVVSCQSVNEGAQNAYRRMLWEDARAAPDERLDFVLHLGDFIYEIVEYPDEVSHRYGRTIYDIGRVPNGRKVGRFNVPTDLAGYRQVYRAHIADPDIQDARANFPFVCMGDNHEFSWQGWQSFIKYDGKVEPAQRLRVAANQAWWEYIPSRVRKSSGSGDEWFDPPTVADAPITSFDDHGFGTERNNQVALASMTSYRALRFGKHVELLLTDLHSYTMEDPTGRPEAQPLNEPEFPLLFPEEALEILDGGREHDGGNPPSTIPHGRAAIPNFRKEEPRFTVLGREQKQWLKDQLKSSAATWKIWGATNGTLDMRVDPLNLPDGLAKHPWPGSGFATLGGGDFSSALSERAEIYDVVRDHGVTGFLTVSGDRHSFWAGYAARALPPADFEPVGLSFITGSISAPGLAEALEFGLKDHPLRPLYVADRASGARETTLNILLKHGVRSALEYAKSGDIQRARELSNPELAPHVEFVDMAGHGYTVVTADASAVRTEFVCIARPIARAATEDGGPIRYRVTHSARLWSRGERPRLEQRIIEGSVDMSI